MTASHRRIRSLVSRSFFATTLACFATFAMVIVLFGFILEDEIFQRQVRGAAESFLASNPLPQEPHGTLKSLDMEFYVGLAAMPVWLREEIDPAWRDRSFEVFAQERGHFHALVRTLEDGRGIYFLFNARPYIRSTPRIISFMQIIGAMAGIVLLLTLFFLRRVGRKVSDPLESMAAALSDGAAVETKLELPANAPAELFALAAAIEEKDARIKSLIERERQFNRDASHELRTPLAVASGAAEILEQTGIQHQALTRLQTATKDMQQLTEGILWLGREPNRAQSCDVAEVCNESIDAYRHLLGDRSVRVVLDSEEGVQMPVPEPVAHVLIGNILRNAFSYTVEGKIKISVQPGFVEIADSGVGFGQAEASEQGFGVGLSLVERLCVHFGLCFDVQARDEGGTCAHFTWGIGGKSQ